MSIQLKQLQFSAFRTFVEPTEIEFPETGLVLLCGRNQDSKGTSGAGKSNFLHSIAYGLKYCVLPATELQSWYTDDKVTVELDLLANGKDIKVKRSAGKVDVTIDQESIKGTIAVKDSALTEALGLSSDLLSILTHRPQRSGGLFLSKGDAEKKELLTTLLGLEPYERAVEGAEANIKRLKPELERDQKEVLARKAELEVVQEQVPALSLPDLEDLEVELISATEEVVDLQKKESDAQAKVRQLRQECKDVEVEIQETYKEDIQQAQDALRELKASALPIEPSKEDLAEIERVDTLYGEAVDRRSKLDRARQAKVLELEKERSALKQQIKDAQILEQSIPSIEKEISKVKSQLAVLNKNECYTCKQTWKHGDLLVAQKELETQISQLKKNLKEAQKAKTEVQELSNQLVTREWSVPHDPQLDTLKEIEEKLLNELIALKGRVEAGTARLQEKRTRAILDAQTVLNAIETDCRKACKEAQAGKMEVLEVAIREADTIRTKEMAAIQRRDTAQRALSSAKQEVAHRTQMHQAALARVEMATKALQKAQEQLEAREREMAAERDFVALVGRRGFLGAIFDEVLEEISTETNHILGRIPNVAQVTIAFPSETLTKSGTTKLGIVPSLTIRGQPATLKSLSGGMESAVALATDLALHKVISRRTGQVPGWLILDEPFEGLGPVEKEGCLEILQDYARDMLVILVDHSQTLREHFGVIWEIESQSDRSTITIQ